jgi:hypothetical protein
MAVFDLAKGAQDGSQHRWSTQRGQPNDEQLLDHLLRSSSLFSLYADAS